MRCSGGTEYARVSLWYQDLHPYTTQSYQCDGVIRREKVTDFIKGERYRLEWKLTTGSGATAVGVYVYR